jgi:hypothetical protein
VLRHGPHPDDVDRDGRRYGARARALRAVLVAVADAANRDGEHAHPGTAAICDGALYSRRQVQKLIGELVAEGWLVVEEAGGGRGMATVYGVPMDTAARHAWRAQKRVSPVHPLPVGNSALSVTETAHSDTVKGALSGETAHSRVHPNGVSTVATEPTDARRLAELLADLIEANGATRPTVTDEWVACIDRMIRLDRRTPGQIENAIRWAQGDEFWRANILSPRKLREQYERLRLNAMRQRQQASAATGVDAALAVLAEVSQDHRRQA